MYRGTTPTLTFTLPYETNLISKCYVSFFQKERIRVEKELANCDCDGNKISVKLTQADTLSFVSNTVVKIQIRALLTDGNAVTSKIMEMTVKDVLKDGEI